MTDHPKHIYRSSNGDAWALVQDELGRSLVRHQPNAASGGLPRDVAIGEFLSVEAGGPEHAALRAMLREAAEPQQRITIEMGITIDQLADIARFQSAEGLPSRAAALELLVEIGLDTVKGSGKRFWDKPTEPAES